MQVLCEESNMPQPRGSYTIIASFLGTDYETRAACNFYLLLEVDKAGPFIS